MVKPLTQSWASCLKLHKAYSNILCKVTVIKIIHHLLWWVRIIIREILTTPIWFLQTWCINNIKLRWQKVKFLHHLAPHISKRKRQSPTKRSWPALWTSKTSFLKQTLRKDPEEIPEAIPLAHLTTDTRATPETSTAEDPERESHLLQSTSFLTNLQPSPSRVSKLPPKTRNYPQNSSQSIAEAAWGATVTTSTTPRMSTTSRGKLRPTTKPRK